MSLIIEEIDRAFQKSKVTVRNFNLLYSLAMVICCLAAGLLVISYFAIIGGLVYGAAILARHGFVFVANSSFIRLSVFFYAVLGILIAIIIKITYHLFRAMFVRYPQDSTEIEISASSEPTLFYFINRVAKSIGAKPPTRVLLKGGVDASAETGFFSRKRVLRLGICLFSGLSITSLGGIIAHECGHFNQSLGIRMQALVLGVAKWFHQAHRSLILEKLDAAYRIQDSDHYPWLHQLELLSLSLVAGFLGLFLRAAVVISAFASRRMEFAADRYETAFEGSASFEQTHSELRKLIYCFTKAIKDCARLHKAGELPDDLAAYVRQKKDTLSTQDLQKADASSKTAHHDLYSTHPSDRIRVTAAKKWAQQGIFRLDRVASELFADFGVRSRFLTFHYYDVECGIEVFSEQLVPVNDFHSKSANFNQAIESARNYSANSAKLLCGFPLAPSDFSRSGETLEKLFVRYVLQIDQVGEREDQNRCLKEELQLKWNRHLQLVFLEAQDLHLYNCQSRDVIKQEKEDFKKNSQKLVNEIVEGEKELTRLYGFTLDLLSRPELCPEHDVDRKRAAAHVSNILLFLYILHKGHPQLLEAHRQFEILQVLAPVAEVRNIPMIVDSAINAARIARLNLCQVFADIPHPGDEKAGKLGSWLEHRFKNEIASPSNLEQELLLDARILHDLLELRLGAEKKLKSYQDSILKLQSRFTKTPQD
jgi:Zn-dependent protease with chaperone function